MPIHDLPIAEFLQNACFDAVYASPAALFRVLLELRVEPGMRWLFTVVQKTQALILSLVAAVVAGQLARAWPRSIEVIPLPVFLIAAAFLAQDFGMRVLPRLLSVVTHKKKP